MNLALPTRQQLVAVGAHAVTLGIGVVGTLAALGLLSGGDAQTATDAFGHITNGVHEIYLGVSALVATAWIVYRGIANGPLGLLLKAAGVILPSGQKPVIVTDTTTAAATPATANIVATPAAANTATR